MSDSRRWAARNFTAMISHHTRVKLTSASGPRYHNDITRWPHECDVLHTHPPSRHHFSSASMRRVIVMSKATMICKRTLPQLASSRDHPQAILVYAVTRQGATGWHSNITRRLNIQTQVYPSIQRITCSPAIRYAEDARRMAAHHDRYMAMRPTSASAH